MITSDFGLIDSFLFIMLSSWIGVILGAAISTSKYKHIQAEIDRICVIGVVGLFCTLTVLVGLSIARLYNLR